MTSKRAIGAAGAIALTLFLAHAFYRVRQPIGIDDAYMVMRYAKQLLAGHGHAWNPDGQQVFGATGTLHLALVTLLAALLPLADHVVLALASLAFTLLALAALPRICVLLLRSRLREHPWLVALGVWLFLVPQRIFLSPAFSGMDTMSALFANCLVAGAALWLGRAGSTRAIGAAVGAAAVAILARPDDGLYAVLSPLLAVALGGPRPRLPLLLKVAGALALMLAVYLAIGTAIFGDPLPLPFYAKSIGYFAEYSAARAWNPFDYLGQILAMWLPALVVIVLGVTRRTAAEVAALLVPVALTFTYYFGVVQIMGVSARYYVPATPLAIVAAVVVLDDLCAQSDLAAVLLHALARRWPLVLALTLAGPAALRDAEIMYGVLPAAQAPEFPATCYERPAAGHLPDADYNAIIYELSQLAATLPPGTRIALSEHGRIGAAAPQVLLDDLIALHDPQFAHHGFDPEVELARKPDAIWMPHYFYVALWHDLMADERLWAEYDVWPDAFLYGFAIRRDSPHRDELYAGFERIWKRLYPNEDIAAWRATRLRSELPECRRESRAALGAPAKEAPQSAYNRGS
jgi:hypothetical protein